MSDPVLSDASALFVKSLRRRHIATDGGQRRQVLDLFLMYGQMDRTAWPWGREGGGEGERRERERDREREKTTER